MSRKGENIRKRKDGRWEARVFDGLKYKSIYAHSYNEIKELKKKYENKDVLIGNNIRFDKASYNYLKACKNKIKESSYARYSYAIDKYILPSLGSMRISAINRNTIIEFTNLLLTNGNRRKTSGLSNKTINDILSIVKNILSYHYETNNINSNIVKISYLKTDNTHSKILSASDKNKLEAIIKESNEPYITAIAISLFLGLRIGEVSALKWEDIDLKNKCIEVNKTMQRITNEHKSIIAIDKPKTAASNRIVPIPDFLISYLKERQQGGCVYVASGSTKYMEPRALYSRYKSLLARNGIKSYSFHCLRHTFATRCLDSGIDIKTLSELLGHSNVDVTLRVYVHPTMDMKRKAMNKIKVKL